MKYTIAKTIFFAITFNLLLSQAHAEVIVADDFLYAQPTKTFGAGGGFTRQDYAGGQHGDLGQWTSLWNSFGDGVITGADITDEETFNLETDMFAGVTRNGLSSNWLDRDYTLSGLDDEQTIYFGITMRSNVEFGMPGATFSINDAGGPAQIGIGLAEGGFQGILGDPDADGISDGFAGPDLTDDLMDHRLIGKLEINASGSDERLSVWLDPTGVEEAENEFDIEADVVAGLSDFAGNLRLDHVGSGGLVFWDDLALGTTWESVATVEIPRVTMLADTDTGEIRFQNDTGTDLDLTFLQVETPSDLNDTAWESLASQGIGGFQENAISDERLTESSFNSSFGLTDGSSVSWGRVIRRRTNEDLVGHVGTADGLLNVTNVVYGPIVSETTTDFDGNGAVDVNDIDALCSDISGGTNGAGFDLTGDGVVNADDLASFLTQTGVLVGDTNLNGDVAFADFLVLSGNFGQSGQTWSGGDFDCSGDVAFADFLTLSANFGQTAGAEASTVPEPSTSLFAMVGALCLLACRRRSGR